MKKVLGFLRRVWRYQRGNRNPEIEEKQTTQYPKEKGQKDNKFYKATIKNVSVSPYPTHNFGSG
jgi:hypothetical protein